MPLRLALFWTAVVGSLALTPPADAQPPAVQEVPVETGGAIEPPAPTPPPSAGVPRDSVQRDARPVPEEALDAFRNDPTYQYDRPTPEQPSLMEILMRWVNENIFSPLARSARDDTWRWPWLALAVGIGIWVILRLLRADGGGLFGRSDREAGAVGDLLDVEDIESVDLAGRWRAARDKGRYRDAVRWRYLALLQSLAAADWITWQKNKTNHDFLREVRSGHPESARDMAALTRAFEWVWYGDRPVDADRFARLDARYAAFESDLTPASRTSESIRVEAPAS